MDMANPYEWTTPKTADAWDMNRVPASPGIYEVVSVNADGTPRAIVLSPEAAADEPGRYERAAREQFPGTLYIGKACNLKSRLGDLVKSWRSDAKPPYPHKSRETWDRLDAATKAKYPFDSIRLRFERMSKQDWDQMLEAKKKGGVGALWSGSGKDRKYEPVTAITTTENRRMETYKKYHGSRPLLNRIKGETLGKIPDDAFFKWMEEERKRMENEFKELFEDDTPASP
jgi:hypothetical protein